MPDTENAWEARKRRIRESLPPASRVILKEIESVITTRLQDFIGQPITPANRNAVKGAVQQIIETCPYAVGIDPSKYAVEVQQADDDPNTFVINPLNEETAELLRQLQAEGRL